MTRAIRVILCAAALLLTAPALAQPAAPQAPAMPPALQTAPITAQGGIERLDPLNPISVLEQAGRGASILSGNDPGAASSGGSGSTAPGADGGRLDATLSIVLLLTVLSLAPAILVMCTSFTRIIVVLALLRQAIGLQQLPPSQVVTGLALLMTFMVMAPTVREVNTRALQPYQAGELSQIQAWEEVKAPLRAFMFDQIEYAGNWDSVYMLLQYQGVDTSDPSQLTRADVDMLTLVPSFVLSELKIAFLMGFRLYLPFLVIDMVISSVLISMGMLMLPPVFISLPFKLLLFVLVDGWRLVAGSLLESFAT